MAKPLKLVPAPRALPLAGVPGPGAPAQASARQAAKEVIVFEARQQACKLAMAANAAKDLAGVGLSPAERERPARLLQGLEKISEALLAETWPYQLSGQRVPWARLPVEPPNAALNFLDVPAALRKQTLDGHVLQLNRFAGSLMGDPGLGLPSYILAGELPGPDYKALAADLAETLGGDPASWGRAVPQGMAGIASLTWRISAAFGPWVEAFVGRLQEAVGKGHTFEPELAKPVYDLKQKLPRLAGVRARMTAVQQHLNTVAAHVNADRGFQDPTALVIVLEDRSCQARQHR